MSDFSTDFRRRLIDHLRGRALRTDGPFTLRSGEVSDWYLDARQTTFDGEGAALVGAVMAAEIGPGVDAVGGMTMGADPISLATALIAAQSGRSLRAFSIRKQAKDHGTGGRLVGPVGSGDRVVILEDTTTTGGALVEALEVVMGEGLVVLEAIALIDRSGGRAAERVEALGVPYRSILKPSDLGV